MRAGWGALLTLLVPALARAQGAPAASALQLVSADLEYTLGPGVESCPGESMLREEVGRRLGYDPFAEVSGGRAMGRLHTVIAREDQGLTATTEYVDTAGVLRWTKTYRMKGASARDCEVVVSGVAIQMAAELTVFKEATVEPARVELCGPAPATSAPAPTPACLPAPERDSPARSPRARPPWLELGAGVAAMFGMTSIAVTSATGHVGLRVYPFADERAWISVAAEVRGDLPVTVGTEMFGIHQSLLGGSALVCGHWDPSPRAALSASVYGCGMGTVGRSIANVVYADLSSLPIQLLYVATGLRPGLEVRFRHVVALRVQADALFNINGTHYDANILKSGGWPFSLGVGAGTVVLF